MPHVDSQKPLLPSLLDRLIDNEPDVSTEPQWQRAQSLRQFELGVLRDVEAMLNTRQSRPAMGEEFKELLQSVLTFGLPDLTANGRRQQRRRRTVAPRRRNSDRTLRAAAAPGQRARARSRE